MRKVIFLLSIFMFFFKTPATANYEKKFYDFSIESINGDCMSPIGVHATINKKQIKINAYVSSLDGLRHIKTEYETYMQSKPNPGKYLAEIFIKQGAKKLLKK